MDSGYWIKIKIGEHEFEAEGPVEIVQADFAAFKELVAALPAKATEAPAPQVATPPDQQSLIPLDKIMKVEGRRVSLTARSETVDEAALLILLGQKDLRTNQEVTGAELMDGLRVSGYAIDRVDRVMDKLAAEGQVVTMGVHRGRRYRLTNKGLAKAQDIAREITSTVP